MIGPGEVAVIVLAILILVIIGGAASRAERD
jgi:hypothetical protein